MNIVIVGAGTVGHSLAEHLNTQENHISIIDKSVDLCDRLNSQLDVFTVNDYGTNPSALERAGIAQADMVIAVTPSDETNLVVCNFAMQYGVGTRIARIVQLGNSFSDTPVSLEKIGVTHVIEPEREVVRNIIKYIELPGVTEAANFHMDSVYLRGYRITADMPIANKTLIETNALTKSAHILVVLIIRGGQAILPSGSERILPEDEIVAIMPRESLGDFRALVNQPGGKTKKVIVSGDSLTAIVLAEQLKALADRVILVDPSASHAQKAAAQLKGVEVLHGDCTRVEMLQEANVRNATFFIAAGRDTEDNVMSCLLAKAEGAREVIAVSNAQRHAKLFASLGLDHVIDPHTITSQTIIANVIRVPIGSLLRLKNVNVEVNWFVAGKKSRITDRPIRDLDGILKRSVVVGSVFRDNQIIIPSGETVIRAGDEVIVLSKPEDARSLGRLFKSRLVAPASHSPGTPQQDT